MKLTLYDMYVSDQIFYSIFDFFFPDYMNIIETGLRNSNKITIFLV